MWIVGVGVGLVVFWWGWWCRGCVWWLSWCSGWVCGIDLVWWEVGWWLCKFVECDGDDVLLVCVWMELEWVCYGLCEWWLVMVLFWWEVCWLGCGKWCGC